MTFPVYLHLGPWHIHPHFLFEILAYTLAFRLLLKRQIRQDTISPTQRGAVIAAGVMGALVGAKVLVAFQHIYLAWQQWQHFLLLLATGKTIVGGLLGGLVGVELTKKLVGIERSTGDVFVYPLIAGMAIGRIGCFLSGLSDRTYGIATTLPWGINFGDGILRHPTQLYEILFLMGLALVLRRRDRFPQPEGDRFKYFTIAYLSFRLLVDFLKPDFSYFLGLSAIQIACILALIYYRRSLCQLFSFRRTT